MDSLTQIVLGAAVGEATLGKKVGNKALLYGGIAGTIPDLDILFGKFTDTITAIEWHRGFSHSILFFILLSPILGYLIQRIEHKLNIGWKPWTKLFFLSLFTHALLDVFTTWGTQLFWPLNTRLAFNSIFVIDPLYSVPLALCTLWLLFYKRDSQKRRKISRVGLLISTSYLLIGLLVKTYVEAQIKKDLKSQNIEYTSISTRPSAFNIILWNANIDSTDKYLITDYSLFDSQPLQFKSYPKLRNESKEAENFPDVQRLIEISKGWYILEKEEDHWIFNDLRFGLIPKPDGTSFFVFSYKLHFEDQTLIATEIPKTRMDGKFLLKNLWTRIQGN